MKSKCLFVMVLSMTLVAGCNTRNPATTASNTGEETSIVFISVTSDTAQSPQSADMAMKLAGFSIDEGRDVVMFFNVKGVTCPTSSFADDLAFQENSPIKSQLQELIERGADVHVCPICMKALGVNESDLIEGAKVTTRPSLFANIGSGTNVFTY